MDRAEAIGAEEDEDEEQLRPHQRRRTSPLRGPAELVASPSPLQEEALKMEMGWRASPKLPSQHWSWGRP